MFCVSLKLWSYLTVSQAVLTNRLSCKTQKSNNIIMMMMLMTPSLFQKQNKTKYCVVESFFILKNLSLIMTYKLKNIDTAVNLWPQNCVVKDNKIDSWSMMARQLSLLGRCQINKILSQIIIVINGDSYIIMWMAPK